MSTNDERESEEVEVEIYEGEPEDMPRDINGLQDEGDQR